MEPDGGFQYFTRACKCFLSFFLLFICFFFFFFLDCNLGNYVLCLVVGKTRGKMKQGRLFEYLLGIPGSLCSDKFYLD